MSRVRLRASASWFGHSGALTHGRSPVGLQLHVREGRSRRLSPQIAFFRCVWVLRVPATLLETGPSWQQEEKDKSGSCCSEEAFGAILVKGWGSEGGGLVVTLPPVCAVLSHSVLPDSLPPHGL